MTKFRDVLIDLTVRLGWRIAVAAIYAAALFIILYVFLWVAMFEPHKLKAERRRYYNEGCHR